MRYLWGILLVALTSCGFVSDMEGPTEPIGDFALGFAVGVAPHPTKGPASREATPEDLSAALKAALLERFERFEPNENTRFYNIGASVDGYVLAQPGVPIVLSPKSVMVVRVTIFDDATGEKLNDEPLTVTSVEEFSGESAIGSGLTMTAEEQLASITRVVASDLEIALREKHRKEGWFTPKETPKSDETEGNVEDAETPSKAPSDEDVDEADIDEEKEPATPVETDVSEGVDLLPDDSARSASEALTPDVSGDEMPNDTDMPPVVPLPQLRTGA